MNEIMKYLGDVNTPVAVSTVDGDKPKVRLMSFKMVVDGKIYMITSKKKAIYRELEKNNNIEICSMAQPDKSWLRVAAEASFVEDVKLNTKAFEMLPLLEMAYGTPENPEIVLLRLDNVSAMQFSMGKHPVKLEL